MKKILKGFTLVELIIVILIITILSIIWFISYANYMKTTRDSARVSDINNITNWIELSLIKISKYPLPEWNILTWTLNNNNIFYKWIFWEELSRLIEINKLPLDPLLKTNYIYSVSYNKRDYQIWVDFEDEQNVSFNFLNKTYASNFVKSYVKWQYKWYLIYNWNDSKKYITNIPSLILSNSSSWNLLSQDAYFVVNNNLNTINWQSWSFLKTNDLLRNMFNDQNIELQNLDITDCNNFSNIFTAQIINKFWKTNYNIFSELEKKYKNCINQTPNPPVVEPIEENTNLYTLTNINNIFQDSSNIISDNWNTNVCDINNLNVNTELFNWTKNISWALSLSWNTIYKIASWNYTLNWTTALADDWYITFWWDCIWFIWAWTWTTKIISNFTWWWIKTTAWIFWVRWEVWTKTNIIISWITIENSTWATNRYNFWIYGDDKISNITLKDIEVYNSSGYWISLDDSANYNLLSNIKSYNNLGYWVWVTYKSKNNILKNITTYWNSLWWIVVDDSGNNNLENILSYSNTNHGLYLETTSTWNTISWATLYSNTKHGLYVNANSSNNIFKNINSYSNTLDWIFFDWGSNNNIITNSNIYNNTRRWIYNNLSNWNYFNNINVYNNKWTSATIYWVVDLVNSLNVSINNSNIFNNNIHWIYLNNLDNWIINNLHIFSNKKSTANAWNWFYIETTSTWNILNDIYIYNNYWSIENYWTNNKYYWTLKSALNGWLTQWIDWYLSLSNWNFNSTAISMDCSWHLNPSWSSYYWATCVNKSFTWVLSTPITTLNFWSNISKQKRPVKWNFNTSQFELYWTDWVDYNTSKFIWEF